MDHLAKGHLLAQVPGAAEWRMGILSLGTYQPGASRTCQHPFGAALRSVIPARIVLVRGPLRIETGA